MSASSVLSVIAPVSGATPSPPATADEATSSAFAAMVAETDVGEDEVKAPDAAALQTHAGDRKATRREAAHASIRPAATPVEVPAEVAEADKAGTADITPDAPASGDPTDVSALAASEDPEPSEAADAELSAPAQPAIPARVPAQASPATPTVAAAAVSAGVPARPEVSPPAPTVAEPAQTPLAETESAPSFPAQASDTARAAAEAAPVSAQVPAPAPKAEPVRLSAAARDGRSEVTPAPATETQASSTKASPEPAASAQPASPQAAPRATEPALTPARGAEALKPLVAADTTAPAPVAAESQSSSSSLTQTPAAAPASALSRATLETTIQIAARIVRQLEAKQTRFDMVLTPEDLGRVEVSLDIDADGQLAARLAFDNPAAAADLRARADELRRQLIDAGFQLAGDSLEFSERDANAFSGGFGRGQDRAFSFAGGKRLGDEADQAVAARPAAWINLSLTPDRVDMRV